MKLSTLRSALFHSALLAVAVAASSCGKDASLSAPSQPQPSSGLTRQAADDLARQFAATMARQGGLPLTRLGGTTVQEIATGRAPQRLLANPGVENRTDEGSFSWAFSIKFFDASGNPQQMFVPGSTARAEIMARARGSLSTAEHQASVGVYRLLDVRGLLPDETELLVNGAANDTADASFEASDGSASRSYHFLGRGALVDVRQLKDERVNPYPLGGQARWNVNVDAFADDAEGPREAHYQASVVITFNGTRHPEIEISESYRYSMDLETGEITPLPPA
jgi:hypothetical protein